MSNFGDKVKGTLAFQAMAGELETTTAITHIPINKICCRFQNKYINNIDKHKSLKESIRSNGLIEPIIVMEIDEYIRKDIDNGELEYLKSMKEKGCKYFISSGHRRFKAFASLAADRDIYSDEDVEYLYSEEFAQKYSAWKNRARSIESLMNGEQEDAWFEIPSKIVDFGNEVAIYNDSNTTQREITAFEIIDNAMDELKANGEMDEIIERVKQTRINSMTERAIKDNLKLLVAKGVINELTSTRLDTMKEILKSQDMEYIPGTENLLNKELAEVISQKKQREISVSSVKVTRQITEKFAPKLIKCIYDGKLSFRNAKELLPLYEELDLDKTVEEINNGSFEIEKMKKRKKIKFTERQLIDLIYDIKAGKKTVDEVIELINQ